MQAVILSAGFAKRLRPLTDNLPKSLLPFGKKTVIDEQIKCLEEAGFKTVSVIANQKFYKTMEEWRSRLSTLLEIKIINNRIANEKESIGSVGDLVFFIEETKPKDDLFIIGSDNLFEDSFDGLISFYKKISLVVIATHKKENSNVLVQPNEVFFEETSRRVISFQEKPYDPRSIYFSSLLYIFPRGMLELPAKYLREGGTPDGAGNFIKWLIRHGEKVFAYEMAGKRFDIGDPDSYRSALELYPFHRSS